MDEIVKKIGAELKKSYAYVLRLRMDWRMIDTVARLEEREDSDQNDSDAKPPKHKPDRK